MESKWNLIYLCYFVLQERKLPSGEDTLRGDRITFSSATRKHSGIYICTADNGFGGEPVEAEIKLDVQRKLI